MKFAMITYNTLAYQPLADISAPTKQAYCDRHGYTFVHRPMHMIQKFTGWDRMQLALDFLPEYDWVMWTGADVIVTNPAQRIERLIDQYGIKSMAACADIFGLNSDVMLFRNCRESKEFLEATLSPLMRGMYANAQWQEQQVMIDLLKGAPHCFNMTWLPQEAMNSYPYNECAGYGRAGYIGTWYPDHFMVQLVGLDMNTRLDVARECLSRVEYYNAV